MAVLLEKSSRQNSAYRSGCHKFSTRQEKFMSAPSRRPEIRRRRTRKEKAHTLRMRYAKASAENERKRIEDKLRRLGLASPGNPLLKNS
jgi:hypothetical protein